MEFRSFLGKYYLTSSDWREINSTVADIQDYYKEIQAEILRQEELKRQQELERERKRQNELQRKHAREYLETIEELLEEEIEEEEPEENADVHMSPISSDDFQGRFSIAASELSNYDAYDEINLSSFRDAYYGAGMTRSIPMDMTFTEKLLHLMRDRHMTNPDVYKAANVDKSLFSRITSDKYYSPSKETAISIALALRLTLEEAQDLLKRAGYTISHSILRDAAIEYCFREKIYNVVEVNILLDKLKCTPLSRIRY